MPYIDTNTRTKKPLANEKQDPMGRFQLLHGVYVGFIKDASDVQRNGRLRVWIPEFGNPPDEEKGWVIVNYCSPFAGATNVETASTNTQTFEGTQTSYGMWMIPPDINNQVLVMFANGDSARGFWIGCLYNQYMNNMVPGMSGSASNYQYPGEFIPVAEYNKKDTKITQPDRAIKPYEATKFKGLGNQGLIKDRTRGVTTSSARRESPSQVFGIITPGPAIQEDAKPADIRRKGGSSFIMDDKTGSEYVQLATKSGAQIRLDETNGIVYLINRDGTAWVQLDKEGNINIFGAANISMRAQRDINLRADRNINIEAGQNLFMKAAMDTVTSETEFTYDVNNVPTPTAIPYYKYVGEGAGEGGNIVMQSLHNWHSTATKNAFLTVLEDNMNLNIGNSLAVQTKAGGQDFSSKMGIKMTTDAALDLAVTGDVRLGANGKISVVAAKDLVLCTNLSVSVKATENIRVAAAEKILMEAMELGVTAPTKFSSTVGITGILTAQGTANLNAASANLAGMIMVPLSFTSPAPDPAEPAQSDPAISAAPSAPAEVKPLNEKTNILAVWEDAETKFKRESESLKTITSKFPTYEPCPEHESFSPSQIAAPPPELNEADKTYEGSSAPGNTAATSPETSTEPGAENEDVAGDPVEDDSFSKGINLAALKCQLELHEGVKNEVYTDTLGLPTAGVGHLLRDNEKAKYPVGTPISKEQVNQWYENDSASAIKVAQKQMGPAWDDLSDTRKRAVVDLAYNLGPNRLAKFTKFTAAMKDKNYDLAAAELKNSKWATQVGRRAGNVTNMIAKDVDSTSCNVKHPGK